MNYVSCGILLLLLPMLLIQEAQGQEQCDWTLQDNSLSVMDVSYSDSQKVFTKIKSDHPLVLNCVFDEPISLQNKLIGFDFQIKSIENYDFILSLNNADGNTNYVSSSIMKWYDITQDKQANVVLDPANFEKRITVESTGTETDLDTIKNIKLEFNQNNFESISVSNLDIIAIGEYPRYNLDENLPIQSTIPGFFGLILVSFPLGFVILSYSNFLKEENFFVKIPWFLGFGFCLYVIFIFIASQFWISFEVVLGYVILELGVLVVYLKKKKIHLINLRDGTSRNILIFFSITLIIAGALSINYVESIGWPTGLWDSKTHATFISLSVEKNILDDGKSLLPVSDIPGWDFGGLLFNYPKGIHTTATGLSFLTGTLPAVTIESINGFIIFLIPIMLLSIVYKFSKSIFLASIMFVATYWIPRITAADIMIKPIITSNLASMGGIIIMLTCFMIFIAYFEKGHKLKLLACFSLSIFALAVSYYGYVALPILIGITGILMYYTKNNKKRVLVFLILAAIFVSMPLWSFTLLESVGQEQTIPYTWTRYASSQAFNPSSTLFPFWVLTTIGLISAGFLFKEKRYRPFSIVVLFVSLVHLLPISHDLALYYGFFYKALRSTALMFLLSISINLVMIHFITRRISLNPNKLLSKLVSSHYSKIIVLGLFVLLLFPGFIILDDRKEFHQSASTSISGSHLYNVPGGNERNLQYWIYENTKPDDLILNDLNHASGWLLGFKAQPMINGWKQEDTVTKYRLEDEKFRANSPGVLTTLRANEILKHPWDYNGTKEIVNELGIDYLYISERSSFSNVCQLLGYKLCYPHAEYWPHQTFSGSARIAMYENHPNLELVLRNGNSAIFKVI